MILPPPVQKMTGRHSVFSSSKMQAKLKNALQLSFATCQHSPWFLMTFQMMHKPRIRNSNLQFCPISNFNLRCNFLQSLHFTVTLWTSFFKYRELLLFLYFIEGNKLSRFSVRCLKTQEVKGFHLHAMTIFELIHWLYHNCSKLHDQCNDILASLSYLLGNDEFLLLLHCNLL